MTSPRQEQLLREAARMFAEYGYHGVSIEDLGSAVGISGPAVYKHFSSKDALLADLLVGISEDLLEGGRVEVAGSRSPAEALERLVDRHLAFSLSEPDLIRVQDRGIGVAEKDRARIFDEFCRVDDSLSSGVQGAGLGLTIALRIARDHGGGITCAPREGGGSDFTVRIPAAADEGTST